MSQVATIEDLERELPSVLNEHATETQLANILESKVPPLRCVGEDWFIYGNGVWSKTSREQFKPLALSIQHQKTRTARKATEILKHLEFSKQTDGKEFRSFHFEDEKGEILLNCKNCVLGVSAFGIRKLEHSENYHFTGQVAANFNPEADAPDFERALQFSLPDPKDIDLLRCFCGYILVPDCRYRVALVCYGPTRTGKNTIAAGIESVLSDDLVTHISLTQLSDPNSKNLAKLAGSALNLASELKAIEVSSENFKQLVGSEGIEVDRKYRDSVSLFNTAKFWFNANHLPRFSDGSDAEAARLHFLRFDHQVSEIDETLKERIRSGRDGVFNFMLDGLRTLLAKRKFPEPSQRSVETKERFTLHNDPIKEFITTKCKTGAKLRIEKTQLFEAYKAFCDDNEIPYGENSNRWFFRELKARYQFETIRPSCGLEGRPRELAGIGLRDD